ncbi:MAG TPA: hypothetical protein VME44_19755 [Streptosporangiaceae bacterium]|nr:hypothetical protein [Streptosporangiaceae bacterium]
MAELSHVYGDFADPEAVGVTPFDIGEINKTMAGLAWQDQGEPDGSDAGQQRNYPVPLAELLGVVQAGAGKRELRQLIGRARLDQPVLVDIATASQMVRPYSWLLNHVGDDGTKLTAADHLPPAHVEAAMTELGLGEEWIGKGNRENQTLPVLHLRESASAMGLLRKRHGTLLLSSPARKLRGDPVALWWHLAKRMPPTSRDTCEAQAGLILLLALAAETADDPDVITARLLGMIGWVNADGTELTELGANHASWDTKTVLRRVGALSDDGPRRSVVTPTAEGVAFARAALRTWH